MLCEMWKAVFLGYQLSEVKVQVILNKFLEWPKNIGDVEVGYLDFQMDNWNDKFLTTEGLYLMEFYITMGTHQLYAAAISRWLHALNHSYFLIWKEAG